MRHFDASNAPIDLNLLSLFIRVADLGSFAQAAQKLALKRSSVSRAVATLEQSLRVQLFSRTTRRVALTTAGVALYGKVRPLLASLGEALGDLPEREQQPSGLLRITATTDIGVLVLPAVIAGFALRYPDVSFDLRFTAKRVDLVGDSVDVALRIGVQKRLEDSSLVARRVGQLLMELYAAPSYVKQAGAPRNPEDLPAHRFLTIPLPHAPEVLPLPPPSKRLYGDDILFIRQVAEAGMGVALLPTFVAQESVAAGRLVRVLNKVRIEAGNLYFVHPPAAHVPLKVTAFRDYLVTYLATHPLHV